MKVFLILLSLLLLLDEVILVCRFVGTFMEIVDNFDAMGCRAIIQKQEVSRMRLGPISIDAVPPLEG
ncbi:hypothetical protein CRM22_003247 [Opisthorchis felineus]|uniref:Secreted protein n=1 Tax=Opisthorchis felineus TaxID=147828 RepID=A0A4S2M261_OPIFE|nr:hypothetical protein CRM22_003247 [Opisthorchis felineus]